MAAVHVLPPSVDTSTLATPIPVPSFAVPVTDMLVPLTTAPAAGPDMAEDGGVLSTVTLKPVPGVSTFPERSVARDFIV